jgi:hypothetical protein
MPLPKVFIVQPRRFPMKNALVTLGFLALGLSLVACAVGCAA